MFSRRTNQTHEAQVYSHHGVLDKRHRAVVGHEELRPQPISEHLHPPHGGAHAHHLQLPLAARVQQLRDQQQSDVDAVSRISTRKGLQRESRGGSRGGLQGVYRGSTGCSSFVTSSIATSTPSVGFRRARGSKGGPEGV
eukprot:773839-Prorocentrum_minimum.AAC.1